MPCPKAMATEYNNIVKLYLKDPRRSQKVLKEYLFSIISILKISSVNTAIVFE